MGGELSTQTSVNTIAGRSSSKRDRRRNVSIPSESDSDMEIPTKRNRGRTASASSDSDSDMDIPTKNTRTKKSGSGSDSDMDLKQRPASSVEPYKRATGQLTAAQVDADEKVRKEREEAALIASGALRRNSKTVFRDANGKVIKDIDAVMAEKAKIDGQHTLTKEEQRRQRQQWNRGIADVRKIIQDREQV